MILREYEPKHYGKEFRGVLSIRQYPMVLAVALGVKTSFDDWVKVDKYDALVEACEKYGLHVEPDVMFTTPESQDKSKIIGGENITTTFQKGMPFDKNAKDETVHVIIAKSPEVARKSKKFGWYSVIINNRTFNKPFVDHLRFGKLLGFPDCCVDFFRKYNNWHVYNHPYETLKNTKRIEGKAIGSYYCNNVLMDNIYFFIHHLPCSYRCEATIEYAKKVEAAIEKVEPEFVEYTKKLLKSPLLNFGEKNFIIFDGEMTIDGNVSTIEYKDSQYFSNYARKEAKMKFASEVEKGNKVIVDENTITILKDDEIIVEVSKEEEWFAINFD